MFHLKKYEVSQYADRAVHPWRFAAAFASEGWISAMPPPPWPAREAGCRTGIYESPAIRRIEWGDHAVNTGIDGTALTIGSRQPGRERFRRPRSISHDRPPYC